MNVFYLNVQAFGPFEIQDLVLSCFVSWNTPRKQVMVSDGDNRFDNKV